MNLPPGFAGVIDSECAIVAMPQGGRRASGATVARAARASSGRPSDSQSSGCTHQEAASAQFWSEVNCLGLDALQL